MNATRNSGFGMRDSGLEGDGECVARSRVRGPEPPHESANG
jgi:hypothetical protein